MSTQLTEDEKALHKLGERCREGYALQHPMSEQSRATVKDAVREEWEREQSLAKSKVAEPPSPEKSPDRQRVEPDLER